MHFISFFFSSRRRHTRSLCDWSSDVCSSDLGPSHYTHRTPDLLYLRPGPALVRAVGTSTGNQVRPRPPVVSTKIRSEERRVGKECRYRGSPYEYKKKTRKWVEERACSRRPTL